MSDTAGKRGNRRFRASRKPWSTGRSRRVRQLTAQPLDSYELEVIDTAQVEWPVLSARHSGSAAQALWRRRVRQEDRPHTKP